MLSEFRSSRILLCIRQFSTAIPQVPGLPYLGAFNKIDENNLHLQLSELASDYSKLAQLKIGPTAYNIVTDANVAQTVLKRDDLDCFPPFTLLRDVVMQLQPNRNPSPYTFHDLSEFVLSRTSITEGFIQDHLRRLETHWDRQIERNGIVENLQDDLKHFFKSLLGRVFFDQEMDNYGVQKEGSDQFKDFEEIVEALMMYAWYPPIWRYIGHWISIPGPTRVFTLCSDICHRLRCIDSIPFRDDNEALIKFFLLYQISSESLGILLSQILTHVSKHKWMQDDLRQGDEELFQSILFETLRVHNPIYLYNVINMEAFDLDEFSIPQFSNIMIAPWIYNLDEHRWPDARKWKADRFKDQPGLIKEVFHCFPFGFNNNFLYSNLANIVFQILDLYELENVGQAYHFRTGLCLDSEPGPKIKIKPFGKELVYDRVRGPKWKQFQAKLDSYERTLVPTKDIKGPRIKGHQNNSGWDMMSGRVGGFQGWRTD